MVSLNYEVNPYYSEHAEDKIEELQSIVASDNDENDDVIVQLRVQPRHLRLMNNAPNGNLSLEICLHGIPHGRNTVFPNWSLSNPQFWRFNLETFDYPIRRSWLNHRTTANNLLTENPDIRYTSSFRQKILCSLEFMLWSTEEESNVFLSEYSLSLGQWASSHAEHATWPSFPFDIFLRGNDGKTSAILEVQIGLRPVQYDGDVTIVTRALEKMFNENEIDPYLAPSTRTIGMREELEDFSDEGASGEEASNDEESPVSDSDQEPVRKSLEALTLDPLTPHKAIHTQQGAILQNDSEQMKRISLLHKRKSQMIAQHPLENTLASDTDVMSETDMNRRSWTLRKPSFHTTGSKSDSANRPHVIMSFKSKRRTRRRRRKAGSFNLKTNSDLLGIIMIEVISARDLPRWRNLTKTSFDMDPFVVISFHRKVFRTRILRHTLNPEWREKLLLHVHKNQMSYNVRCAVYDWDNMSANDYVGELSLDLNDIMSAAPVPNPETGLYDLNCGQQSHSLYYDLPLTRERGDEDQKFGTQNPTLQITAVFQPYDALRQRFWLEMLRLYDSNETGGIDIDELETMLFSLGSTLTEKTVQSFFSRYGKVAGHDELTFLEGIRALEGELLKPNSERQQVHLNVDREEADDDAFSADEGGHVERVIQLSTCPICLLPRLSQAEETDIVTHLALCTSRKGRSVDDIMVSNFVTATQARRKWYTNIFTVLSQGHYRIGANSANILVQERLTGQVIEEKMQVYVRLGIRLLYQGARSHMNGARVRRMLRNLTFKQGFKYDHPSSVRAIAPFISFHGINVDEMVQPVDSFLTFNDFFCRRIQMSLRPLAEPDNPRVLVCCADCRLLVFESVDHATNLWIKGRQFSIEKLLGNTFLSDAPRDPSLVIFRLAPQDYHRFHSPVDGVVGNLERIEGEYYTVNPMAIRSTIDVYGENVRAVVPIYTKEFGTVILTAIGAMMVGSIILTVEAGQSIKRGDELGYFKFGGSTLVLLVERTRMSWDSDLLANADTCMETLVRVGMRLGEAKS